jgi:hypothetical protein
MTKPTMTSQWDPGSYRPLDMSEIPGYPRKMPPRYEDFLPRFAGIDDECPKSHMRRFWKFFQHFPVSDEAEDLVMKLFSSSLHGEARRWYDNLPAASINSMELFEEVFLAKWTMEMENVQSLLKELEGIKQKESEVVRAFGVRFQRLLYQIPQSHRPEGNYLVYLYTNGLQGHLSFLLNKKNPKTLAEAHNMAVQIEKSLSSNAMDTLSLIKLVSHGNFVEDMQKRGEQVSNQQNEDMDEEQEPEQDDEVSTCAPPTDEDMREPVSPVQQSENEVSYFPLQNSNDTVLLDSKEEEEMEASDEVEVPCCEIEDKEAVHEDEIMTHDEDTRVLEVPAQEETVSYPPILSFDDALPCDEKEDDDEFLSLTNLACYDIDSDIVDNIDEFIHVGRRRWDVVGYDLDPIYDTESHLQLLPLQLSQQFSPKQWQQGDEVFTCSFQNTKEDLLPYLSDDFQSYLEMFDEYPTEHLDLIHEDDCQPPLCSDFDTSKDIVCLKKVTHDFSSQSPIIVLPCFSIQGVVGKYLFRVEFPPGQTLDFKGWLSNAISNQFFNLLLIMCQCSTNFLSILSLEHENALGNQFIGPLSRFAEPSTFHDPFSDRIEYFSQSWTWQDFVPPTCLHELDFGTPDNVIYVLTHDIFVLDLSLFWFMMKHKGRYQGALLDWLHWLFDYTNMQPTGKYLALYLHL